MRSLAIDFTNMAYRSLGVNAFVQFIDSTGDSPSSHLPADWDYDNVPIGEDLVYTTSNLVEGADNLVEGADNLVGTTLAYSPQSNFPFNAGPQYEVVNLLDEDGNNLVIGADNLVANIRVDAEHQNRIQ